MKRLIEYEIQIDSGFSLHLQATESFLKGKQVNIKVQFPTIEETKQSKATRKPDPWKSRFREAAAKAGLIQMHEAR